MAEENSSGGGEERRTTFLAATVEIGGVSSEVRIRNLSETGAMLEGSFAREKGTQLVLRRSGLEIPAKVVWSTHRSCGVDFGGRLCVDKWVMPAPQTSAEQQKRVDAIQAVARLGNLPRHRSAPRPPPVPLVQSDNPLDLRLAEELLFAQRLLTEVGDELAGDAAVVARHAKAIQNFDTLGQLLGHLATIIGAANRDDAIDRIGMQDLRGRLKRKALFDKGTGAADT